MWTGMRRAARAAHNVPYSFDYCYNTDRKKEEEGSIVSFLKKKLFFLWRRLVGWLVGWHKCWKKKKHGLPCVAVTTEKTRGLLKSL